METDIPVPRASKKLRLEKESVLLGQREPPGFRNWAQGSEFQYPLPVSHPDQPPLCLAFPSLEKI